MSEIDMKRRREGLWFTTNPVLKPPMLPTGDTRTPKATTTRSIHSAKIATDTSDEANETPPLEDHGKAQTRPHDGHNTQPISDNSTWTTANDQSGVSIRTSNWTTPLSKAIQHLELWHQRLGHTAPRTMKRTQQVVDGIPHLPDANPLFCCPFCNKAKMRKSHGGKRSTREAFVPGTSLFHMDLGFIGGPKNLQEVLHNGATPKETIIKSHDGFSSYLLIIDAATRYI
jgi:hypothetical protein